MKTLLLLACVACVAHVTLSFGVMGPIGSFDPMGGMGKKKPVTQASCSGSGSGGQGFQTVNCQTVSCQTVGCCCQLRLVKMGNVQSRSRKKLFD